MIDTNEIWWRCDDVNNVLAEYTTTDKRLAVRQVYAVWQVVHYVGLTQAPVIHYAGTRQQVIDYLTGMHDGFYYAYNRPREPLG